MIDVTALSAFGAGLLSFASPCILPIVPFYLSYLAGVEIAQIKTSGQIDRRTTLRAVITTCFFSCGVIVVFVGLGASTSTLGLLLRDYFDVLRWIAALIIITMGLQFLGLIHLDLLFRQAKLSNKSSQHLSAFGAFGVGLTFAFGWTPCVGPILTLILFIAAGQESSAYGTYLLLIYGIGMTAPFVLAAMFVGPFMIWLNRFKHHLGTVEKVTGLFLIIFGLLIGSNSISIIAELMLDLFPEFRAFG
jgi:cytochrome c-type biogenesis protein|tara:strand:- start:16 stop:756 length:741 start_codon:yes stop_codon:yes gene_type:complete